MKFSYLSQSMLQDDGDCLKSAVTGCEESPKLLDALVLSFTLCDTRWYHIRRSIILVWLWCLLLILLLAEAGLGFVLVHCERTCVESCDNVDHHHTPFHNRCCWSDSSTTHPIQLLSGSQKQQAPVSKPWLILQSTTVLSNQLHWWFPLLLHRQPRHKNGSSQCN